jgi:thiamine pyrophosphokinase
MKCMAIITGGEKDRTSFDYWCKDANQVIGVDGGALWLINEKLPIHLAMGDFDTIGEFGVRRLVQNQIPIEQYGAEKDYTDTELAVEYALSQFPEEIILFGGLGSRFDHSLANLQLAWKVFKRGIKITVIDASNALQFTDHKLSINNSYPFISLLPFSQVVSGVTLEGFKYPLQDAVLSWGESIGISNELTGQEGTITIKSGDLLVIQAKDKHPNHFSIGK